MRAISIMNPYAQMIFEGVKKVEIRSRPIALGKILICVSQKRVLWHDVFNARYIHYNNMYYENCGYAIGIVDIVECGRMDSIDEIYAFVPYNSDLYAYKLANPKRLKRPFPIKGKQGIFYPDLLPSQLEVI